MMMRTFSRRRKSGDASCLVALEARDVLCDLIKLREVSV